MNLALILLIVAVIAGIIGFGIANAVNHIAKFLFFGIIILFLILMFYEYFSFPSAKKEPIPPPVKSQEATIQGSDSKVRGQNGQEK